MANKDKSSFPMLPAKHWWALRNRFKASIPGVVSPSYVAATLNMQEQSARANVILPLRALGIIDDENRVDQELAIAWRDDDRYAKVCAKILQRVYPKELLEAVPDPRKDRGAAERWFANSTGSGAGAVSKMASLYSILAVPDLTGGEVVKAPRTRKRSTAAKAKKGSREGKSALEMAETDAATKGPGIAINLQIHISSDATPDQIDAIFESMAKHIYKS